MNRGTAARSNASAQQKLRVRFVGWDARAVAVVRPTLEQIYFSFADQLDSPKANVSYNLVMAFERFEIAMLQDTRVHLKVHQAESLPNEMLFQNCTFTNQVEVLSTETPQEAHAPKYTFFGCSWPRQSIPQTFRVQGANLCIESCRLAAVKLSYGSLMENSSVSQTMLTVP